MSTRCQTKVRATGLPFEQDEITLYHHTDGYPTYMLPLFAKAYELGAAPRNGYSDAWRLGRSGKAASFLCAADPGVFEPEANPQLHGDIEYLYVLTAQNKNGGSMAEHPIWKLAIYVPGETWDWDKQMTVANMRLLAEGEVSKLAKRAKKIEEGTSAAVS